jgi:hypothetical protein
VVDDPRIGVAVRVFEIGELRVDAVFDGVTHGLLVASERWW